MDLLPRPRRRNRWMFSFCVLAAFSLLSVAALAAPRVDSSRALNHAYTDLASQRTAPHDGRLAIADDRGDDGLGDGVNGRGGHGDGFGDHVSKLFIHKATVCMVSQSQIDLLEQVFYVYWKTVKIDGVDTQVMVIRGVRNAWLLHKLRAELSGVQCKTVNLRVAWLVFVFNPHMS